MTPDTLTHVQIGRDCDIHPSAVIGSRGFGYTKQDDGTWATKAHDFGVVIEDDVHVGANTCIDRGSWRDTRIGAGTRIDNLVHIAHNVQIGRNCIIVAGAEISGSVVLGDGVWVGPNACIRERLTIGDGALIGIGAVVVKDVPPNTTVAGNPAKPLDKQSHPPAARYCFPIMRKVPVWREDPTHPDGGWWDRFHTINVSPAEWKRLQDDGFAARQVWK